MAYASTINDVMLEKPGMNRLVGILLALFLVILPHFAYLTPWVFIVALFFSLWRLAAEARRWRMPPRWLKMLLVLFGFAGVFLTYGTLNGAEAGTALLILMVALKLTETETLRDCVLLVFLGYFLIMSEFLYSQEIPIVIYMLPVAWVLTAVLLTVTHTRNTFTYKSAFKFTGRYLLQALPVAAILFVLFPRIPGPLWGVPTTGGSAVSGLSDEMTPGSISNLILSDEIAFRVEFDGPPPPPELRYWRGPTLHFFNGRTWSQGFTQYQDVGEFDAGDNLVNYVITLEPHQRHWLYALELPAHYPAGAALTFDYLLMDRRPVTQRKRYQITSSLNSRSGTELKKSDFRWSLRIPKRYNPRTQAMIEQWRAEAANDWEIVMRALTMFRQEPFIYTLQPPTLGADSVDEFLFDTKRGFCEHYSSAFTFMMRAAGVPARVVTGYLGGEPNPVSDYFMVRQSDAHAWSEVWIEGRGWIRVDPTGAVAPERIERGLSNAIGANEGLPDFLQRDNEWLLAAQLRWDALNAGWNEFFLAYGPEAQEAFLMKLGMDDPEWEKMAGIMFALIFTFMAGLSLYLVWLNRAPPRDSAARLYERFCRKLAKINLAREQHEGPRDFAVRVSAALPALAKQVKDITDLYVTIRYRKGASETRLKHFSRLVGTFTAKA
ncbi:MAG: DUF3488 and transglutaminase-like domain-containing protein [Gammaproteobacteria bacterium]|nr:DUF3488 and transglutaminase-like domain-containing protein [Gammaproteobacteria bacterium]